MTIQQCVDFLTGLDEAIALLVAARVTVSKKGRLFAARRVLERVINAGAFPVDEAERKELLIALRDASEWKLIATSLGESVEGEFVLDLQRAVAGPLLPDEPGGEPQELQSQLFFGAVLAQDGRFLGVPTGSGLPDFIWPNGTLCHGIEVKSPSAIRGIQRGVATADAQVGRLSGGGMVVMDVSYLLPNALSAERPLLINDHTVVREKVGLELQPLKDELRRRVATRGSWEQGRGVTASALVARVHHWQDAENGGGPASAMAVAWRRYYSTYGTLAYWRATALGERVGEALRLLMPDLEVKWEY